MAGVVSGGDGGGDSAAGDGGCAGVCIEVDRRAENELEGCGWVGAQARGELVEGVGGCKEGGGEDCARGADVPVEVC